MPEGAGRASPYRYLDQSPGQYILWWDQSVFQARQFPDRKNPMRLYAILEKNHLGRGFQENPPQLRTLHMKWVLEADDGRADW